MAQDRKPSDMTRKSFEGPISAQLSRRAFIGTSFVTFGSMTLPACGGGSPESATGSAPVSSGTPASGREAAPASAPAPVLAAVPAAPPEPAAPPAPAPSPTPYKNLRTGQSFARMQLLADAGIRAGDEITVEPGTYTVSHYQSIGSPYLAGGHSVTPLLIRSAVPGVRAILDMKVWSENAAPVGQGVTGFVQGPACLNLTVRDIEVRLSQNNDQYENAFANLLPGYGNLGSTGLAATFTMESCKIHGAANGIITGPNNLLKVFVRNCVFQDCSANGLSHYIYASDIDTLDVSGSHFYSTTESLNGNGSQRELGHIIKSRGRNTTLVGNRFHLRYSVARAADIANGGHLIVAGNIFVKYPNDTYVQDNSLVCFGAEQRKYFNAGSPSFIGGTDNFNHHMTDTGAHSIVMAQNTVRKVNLGTATPYEILKIYPDIHKEDGSNYGAIPATVRNNLVAGTAASGFLASFPGNTAVDISTISDEGTYSGTPVVGSAADAAFAYAGEFLPPQVRVDAYQGGRSVNAAPAWIASAAWTWTDIPGTNFGSVFRNDGTGVDGAGRRVPALTQEIGGVGGPYWANIFANGGPAWDPVSGELYGGPGGGHNSTSANPVMAWRLARTVPDMVLLSAPTAFATRLADYQADIRTKGGYHSDGKPVSNHSYRNWQALGGDLINIGLMAVDTSNYYPEDSCSFDVTASFARSSGYDRGGDGMWRAAGHWPAPVAAPGEIGGGIEALCVRAKDGSAVFQARGNPGKLRRLDATTRTWSQVTTADVDWSTYAHGTHNPTLGTAGSIVWASYNWNITGHAGWYVQRIDIATGNQTAISIAGLARDGSQYGGLEWHAASGKYYLLLIDGSGYRLVSLTPGNADHTAMAAAQIGLTGTAPTDINFRRQLYIHDGWGILIVCDGPNRPLKHLRIA